MATKLKINRYVLTLSACILVNLIVCVWILVIQGSLPPQVPLFYGLPQGEEQLTFAQLLLVPPVIAIIISIINFLLIRAIKVEFLKMVLLAGMVLTTILSSVTIAKIIWIL
jgi:hypothetical protein